MARPHNGVLLSRQQKRAGGCSALDESRKLCANWSQCIHQLICLLYCDLKPEPFTSGTSTLPPLLLVLTTELISYTRSRWLPRRWTGRRTFGADGRVCVVFSESHRCLRLLNPVELDTALGKPGGGLPPSTPAFKGVWRYFGQVMRCLGTLDSTCTCP